MDRLVQRNVLATSGPAVEAAGDVDTLPLDKTGTITFGNRPRHRADPGARRPEVELAAAARLSSLADQTPEGRSIVELCATGTASRPEATPEEATGEFVPFTAQTRMSGLDVDGRAVRKGAGAAVACVAGRSACPRMSRSHRPEAYRGRDAARRRRARPGKRAVLGVDRADRCGQARHAPSGSPNCARWASARS